MKTKRSKIGRRGKTMLAVLIAIMFVSVATAALIPHYGKIETTAEITQSLTLNGKSWDDPIIYTISSPAGNTYIKGPVAMKNHADNPIPVTFETIQEWDDGGWKAVYDAVTTRYYGELVLDNKDDCTPGGAWSPTPGDDTGGLLKYYLDGPTFDYEFSATGLQVDTEYSLIYYADEPDRYVNWGGDNPGALIGTFTTDANGDITLTTGSEDLGMDLPCSPDANIDEYDYSGYPDYYVLHHGAKIWLVLSADYTAPELTGWNPNSYLFETNLISYDDAEVGAGFIAYQWITNFYIEYTFDPAAMPGTYKVTTTISPTT